MLDVISALVSKAMLNGFSIAVENAKEVDADVLVGHALIKEEFGDVDLEEGLKRVREVPDHRLRALADWFDTPRLVEMTPAAEYRKASKALNRAALAAHGSPTIDNIGAWLFTLSRYQRAQERYPLSKPIEPIERDRRIKAAAALAPSDFSVEAQSAIVELCNGDRAAGRQALVRLVAEGADPGGHITAVLCKVDDGHWHHLNRLADKIARQTYERERKAEAAEHVTQPEPPLAPSAPYDPKIDETAAIEDAAMTAALEELGGWVERAWLHIKTGFHAQDGFWVFENPIRNKAAGAAYPIAGRSEAFQTILRERLGAPA